MSVTKQLYKLLLAKRNGFNASCPCELIRSVQEAKWEVDDIRRELDDISRPEEKHEEAKAEYHKKCEETAEYRLALEARIADNEAKLTKPYHEYANVRGRAWTQTRQKSHPIANAIAVDYSDIEHEEAMLKHPREDMEARKEILDNFGALKDKYERQLWEANESLRTWLKVYNRRINTLAGKVEKQLRKKGVDVPANASRMDILKLSHDREEAKEPKEKPAPNIRVLFTTDTSACISGEDVLAALRDYKAVNLVYGNEVIVLRAHHVQAIVRAWGELPDFFVRETGAEFQRGTARLKVFNGGLDTDGLMVNNIARQPMEVAA
ncbi:MAG: hypothetical protein ACYTEQ_01670 [Planctomycetota bacterium]|jgi:F0F1-type ATP synthase membrane subunit b/b'